MRYLYAIKDIVANELVGMQMYLVFTFRTDAQAERYFADSVSDEKSVLNRHPEDYVLLKIAQIDEDGDITGLPHTTICTGKDLTKQDNGIRQIA